MNKTLYKKDSRSKLLSYKIYTEGAEIHTIHGRVDGKQQHDSYTTMEKNTGKANYRSAEMQAEEELKSKVTNQKKYNELTEYISSQIDYMMNLIDNRGQFSKTFEAEF